MRREEYLDAAREFARDALRGRAPPVVIQNAHKAVEFALMVYSIDSKGPMPRDHWQTKNLAYRISKDFGKKFGTLMEYYLGAYRGEDGDRAERARKLMVELLKELEGYVGETLVPSE